MRARLIAGVLVSALALMTGVLPCAAMTAPAAEDAHDCCDHSDQRSHESKTNCELRCAAGRLPSTAADKASFQADDAAITVATPDSGAPSGALPAPDAIELRRPPDHGPSLFILHAAFLI